jgi:CRP/FNR family transcriptional regulator
MTDAHALNPPLDPLVELRASTFFKDLPPEQITRLARAAHIRTYGPGELIAAENDPVRGFFLVLSGQVKLFKLSPDGREQTIYIFRPGEPFCLCSLFTASRLTPRPWPKAACC